VYLLTYGMDVLGFPIAIPNPPWCSLLFWLPIANCNSQSSSDVLRLYTGLVKLIKYSGSENSLHFKFEVRNNKKPVLSIGCIIIYDHFPISPIYALFNIPSFERMDQFNGGRGNVHLNSERANHSVANSNLELLHLRTLLHFLTEVCIDLRISIQSSILIPRISIRFPGFRRQKLQKVHELCWIFVRVNETGRPEGAIRLKKLYSTKFSAECLKIGFVGIGGKKLSKISTLFLLFKLQQRWERKNDSFQYKYPFSPSSYYRSISHWLYMYNLNWSYSC